jgi:small GTP-binding protein
MEEHKVVVLGSGGVGKSACTLQFIKSEFSERYNPTIEDAYTKQLTVDEKSLKLHVLDTAGQEEYSALRDTYMRDGEGFILVFSLTDPSSIHEVEEIHKQLLRSKDAEAGGIPIVVIGNKCDLVEERSITPQECKSLIDSFGKQVVYFEASAKKKINIDEAFETLVKVIRRGNVAQDEVEEEEVSVPVNTKNSQQRKGLFSSISNSRDQATDLNQIKNVL